MDGHRPLQIEVLINSPGPHDQVRVRDPFLALQGLGLDCRIHERPFLFNSCIRPYSLVIWQRPLPESRQRQWEHLQWLRQRGCLLLTEWDDHPRLFPTTVQWDLVKLQLAPLELCHGIHTSSSQLAELLRPVNPVALVLDNTVAEIPPLNLQKHSAGGGLRVFIGNQNREKEHRQLVEPLRAWLLEDPNVQLVVVGDQGLMNCLPAERLETHPILPYSSYKKLLGSCLIALLPLERNQPNRCKTPIKWLECAAESVAVVAGPELYNKVPLNKQTGLINNLEEMISAARKLSKNEPGRKAQVEKAYAHTWTLQAQLPLRLWLYKQLWKRRAFLDALMLNRVSQCAGLPKMQSGEFKV